MTVSTIKPARAKTAKAPTFNKSPSPRTQKRAASIGAPASVEAVDPQGAHTPLVFIPPEQTKPKPPAGKLGVVVDLLRRPEGATVAQISAATDWQPHSVRGAMAGALKKKHGLTITSEPAEGGRIYRLAAVEAA